MLAVAAVACALLAGVRNDTLTVSGISAGAAMAAQYEVAFSASVRGAGIVAGIPVLCSAGNLDVALTCMVNPLVIDPSVLNANVLALEKTGFIDKLSNLAGHSAILFSGTKDTVVAHGTMKKLAAQFVQLGVGDVQSIFDIPAEHSWITDKYGDKCGHLGTPFVNNCNLDFAGKMLQQFWTHMGVGTLQPRTTLVAGNLVEFDQTKYGMGALQSMAKTGYAYVPSSCELEVDGKVVHAGGKGTCHVHVNFHGCKQMAEAVTTTYVSETGINEWAETNAIIVVYPQTVRSLVVPYNPNGCFDWWGYVDENFATRSAPQMAAVNRMVHAVYNGTL
eukprot:Hpha_TRINITY_DN13725_c0_g1::TRINITY_DN13725_c0_g1_i1::g.142208::m.142208